MFMMSSSGALLLDLINGRWLRRVFTALYHVLLQLQIPPLFLCIHTATLGLPLFLPICSFSRNASCSAPRVIGARWTNHSMPIHAVRA